MSTMDFGAALGGPGALGGTPPPPLGPPPVEAGAPPVEGAEEFENSLQALEVAEEALSAFIRLDPDQADRALAAQCLQNVIKLKAANQKSAQEGGPSSMARALEGGTGANLGLAAGGY